MSSTPFRIGFGGKLGLVFVGLIFPSLVFAQIHPADGNSDMTISLAEMTLYAKAWVEGTEWPTGPSPVTEADFRQAEFIWQKGERYRQLEGVPLPQAWIPDPEDGTQFLAPADLNPEPLDIVEILGIPEGQNNLFAEFYTDDDPGRKFAMLYALDETRVGVVVPFLADQPGGAGPFHLILISDEGEFPVGPMYPEPLPSAPGTAAAAATGMVEVADLMNGLLEASVGSFSEHVAAKARAGSFVDQFISQNENLADELRVPVLLDSMIRDPENPNNLQNIFQGVAPILAEYQLDTDLLDSVHAKLGTLEQIENFKTFLNDTASAITPGPIETQSDNSYPRMAAGVPTESVILSIGNLSELAAAMQKQCEHQKKATPGPNEKAFRDQVSVAMAGLALAGGPVGAAGAASFNTSLYILDTYSKMVGNQWPSDITEFEVNLSHPFFLEDNCEIGTWNASLTATSTGWSLDKTIVSGALNALGAAGALGAGAKASEAARANLSASEDFAVNLSTEVSNFAFGKAFPETGLITVSPSIWTGIEITQGDLGLLDISYDGSSVKAVSDPSFQYTPDEEAGETILRVLTKSGVLGSCAGVQGSAETIEVKENRVSLSPLSANVEPEEEWEFTAFVEDAENKEIEFFVSHGEIIDQYQVGGTDEYRLEWKAPSAEEMPDSIEIIARSTTTECLRADVVREGSSTLTPKVSNLVLNPGVTCVQLESEVKFEVIDVTDEEVPPIQWTFEGPGIFSPSGAQLLYSATNEEGTVTVRATTEEEEPQVLEQTFFVGNCYTVSLIFEIPQGSAETTVAAETAQIIVTDNASNPPVIENYLADGSVEVGTMGGGEVTGTFNGSGAVLNFLDQDPESGKETFLGPMGQELVVTSRVSFGGSEEVYPVELIEPGMLLVHFAESALLSGSWWGEFQLEFTNFEWVFSDGGVATGAEVSHVFDTDHPYDQWVRLTVTTNGGHVVSFTQEIRFIDFSSMFNGPYDPSIPTTPCINIIEVVCPGDIILAGPRSANLDQTIISTTPSEDRPGNQFISVSY